QPSIVLRRRISGLACACPCRMGQAALATIVAFSGPAERRAAARTGHGFMTGTLLRAALLVLAAYPLAMRGLAVMAAPRRARLAEIGHELLISPFAAPNVKTAVRLLL